MNAPLLASTYAHRAARAMMWVQEQTCRLLGVRRHHQAMPPLVDVARNGQHNGKIAAIIALKHMRTHEADTALHHLERELGLAFAPYFRR
jgi:hypothetical protein